MSVYTEAERAFLTAARLGRIATVDRRGLPHVVPTTYTVAEDGVVEIKGADLERSKKFRDVAATGVAAFVVDDVSAGEQWRPRGVEVRGRAEVIVSPGEPRIRIVPARIVAWGLDTDPYVRNARTVAPG